MPDGSSFTPRVPPELPPKPKPLKWGVRWAEDGMYVWLAWNRARGSAIRCKVVVAAGDMVRIVNEKFEVDTWKRLDDLLVPEGDPHGYD
jgi:hypothetical protein